MKADRMRKPFTYKPRIADVAEGCEFKDFFEICKPVEQPELLGCWTEWFKQQNIPFLIEKKRRGYVLWRKGNEMGRDKSTKRSAPVKKNIVYSFGI
jgi:hypothetical protein